MAKKAFVVNDKNKTVTRYMYVKATAAELGQIEEYQKYGYEVKVIKTERKNKAPQITDKEIKEKLKDNKEALATYEAMKKDKAQGFFKARKWYLDNFEK